MHSRWRAIIQNDAGHRGPPRAGALSMEDRFWLAPLSLPTAHNGGTGGVVYRQGGLLNGRNHTVQGASSVKPVLPGAALVRRDRVHASGQPSGCVGGLVPFPILRSEPLGEGLLACEVAANPGDRDVPRKQGPEVRVRAIQKVRHVVLPKGGGPIADIPGVRNQQADATAAAGQTRAASSALPAVCRPGHSPCAAVT